MGVVAFHESRSLPGFRERNCDRRDVRKGLPRSRRLDASILIRGGMPQPRIERGEPEPPCYMPINTPIGPTPIVMRRGLTSEKGGDPPPCR